jgi:cobalamin biosynthesis protein CbiG
MIYDKERESFKYYSDSTIPYRYLEVVGRKYVKMFNCRPIFVDMEEELKSFDEKWTKEYELKKAKEAKEILKAEEAAKNNKPTEEKKNVFAKFKSYNKEAGGKISMAAPPKNSIPSKPIETKENEKILLKERANRYTYEGKFANFNFLQKIERKVFNKKLGISFADFKKMKQN